MSIFYAYVVQQTKDFEIMNFDDVADVRPLDIMSDFSTDKLYLSPIR